MFQHANLVAKCDEVIAFDGRTSDDLVEAYLGLSAQYTDCATRHNALVETIRQ